MRRLALLFFIVIMIGCVKDYQSPDEVIVQQIMPLSGKKVMFFGDSITEFTYKGKGLTDYFQEASGAITYKAAVGGSRFSQRKTPTLTPISESEARAALDVCNMISAWITGDYSYQDAAVAYLSSYASSVQALRDCPVADADVVFFASGGNDLSSGVPFGDTESTSLFTINGAINQIVSMLLTAKPSLKVYGYSPLVGYRNNIRDDEHWSDNFIYPAYNKTKPELIKLIEEQVSFLGVPYIDLYHKLGWSQNNFSDYYLETDGTHPYKGFDVLGLKIYQEVLAIMSVEEAQSNK